MESFVIRGGKPLIGEIRISGSKNAALPLMAASLLTDDTFELENVPKLSDIDTMIELLENLGSKVVREEENDETLTLSLQSEEISNVFAPSKIVHKMRASLWVLAPLLSRFGEATVALPGGCAIGNRKIDLHIAVLESMGAIIKIKDDYIHAYASGRLQGCYFTFPKISVGATVTAILAAVLADGKSYLANCAKEPEIADLCNCLNAMGAEISGIGSSDVKIVGKELIFGTKYRVMPDRIEAGTYMIAAAATRGRLNLTGIDYGIVQNLASKLKLAGIRMKSGENCVFVENKGEIMPVNIETRPYPGFSTDLQAQFMCLMSLASGNSTISENIFENRFMHVKELLKMGANIVSINGKTSLVKGIQNFKGAEVVASDLRASACLVIAGLCANGETKISRIFHLDRGYQNMEKKLSECGADICRVLDQ